MSADPIAQLFYRGPYSRWLYRGTDSPSLQRTNARWSIYWANRKNGAMAASPRVGQFKNGRGEFYGTDT